MRVGFIGLGSQGGPMARRIGAAGFPTTPVAEWSCRGTAPPAKRLSCLTPTLLRRPVPVSPCRVPSWRRP